MTEIRALIVDDEFLARRGIRNQLKHVPDVVVIGEAGNGREALAAIREKKPDLVFLDVQMPGLDGFGVIESLKIRPLPQVIFITAYPDRLLTGERPEPAFLITKPYQPDTVKAIVSQALFFERRAHLRDRRISA